MRFVSVFSRIFCRLKRAFWNIVRALKINKRRLQRVPSSEIENLRHFHQILRAHGPKT